MKRLDEIEARANAATEGPWEAYPGYQTDFGAWMSAAVDTAGGEYLVVEAERDKDADFIAHARTDVPALVEALRAVLNLHFKAQPIPAAFGTQEGGDYCVTCAEDWPCPTVETIHQHLGEDA